MHYIIWSLITQPKIKGGLGLASVSMRNISLLGKWHWKWYLERDKWWNRWVMSKYNCSAGDSSQLVSHSKKVSECFSRLIDVANNSKLQGYLDVGNFLWQIRDGENVLF